MFHLYVGSDVTVSPAQRQVLTKDPEESYAI